MGCDATGTVGWFKGRWHARVTVKGPDGKSHRPWIDLERPDIPRTPKGMAQARKLARERSELARRGVFVGKGEETPAAPATVAAIAEKWYALVDSDPGTLRPSTAYDYKSRIRANVVPALGPLAAPPTIPQLRGFLRELKTRRDGATVRNTANALTKLLDDARAEGWIPMADNPMRSRDVRVVLPPMTSPDPEDIVSLTIEQVRVLLGCETIPEERRGLYLLAITSGMRDGELRGLQRSAVDLEAPIPCARVVQQLMLPRGKGGTASIGALKSKWSRRTLPLHPHAVEWFRKHREKGAPSDFMLGDGTRPASAVEFRADLEAAGLPTEIKGVAVTFHALRHTFATLLEAQDTPGDLVDRMLGHAPASTRGRHYAAPSLEAMQRAVLKLAIRPTHPEPEVEEPTPPSEASNRLGNRLCEPPSDDEPSKSSRPGPDSNRRMTVLQTVA